MADSIYPNSLDTDYELPYVSDNITEIGGEAINGLRSAVFNIEETLGINPQGTSDDLTTRLSQALNDDGTIKASALAAVGLVTLPITNSQIATNAGILESKLDLNYTTVTLKTWIDELNVFVRAMNEKLIIDIYNLSQHTAHPSAKGRHQTQDIDGYIGKYSDYNLQGIINDLDTRLEDHITDPIAAHQASAIFVDDSVLSFSTANVQAAIEYLDDFNLAGIYQHQDLMHSNGIARAQDVFVSDAKHSYTIVASSSINNASAGNNYIQFLVSPTGIEEVQRNDRIEISSLYHYYVKEVDTVNNIVYFFGNLPAAVVSGTAAIYRNSEETYEPSVLKLAIRQPKIAGTYGGSVLQLVHPNAPYVLSNGLDVRNITNTVKNIKISWNGGDTGDLDLYAAMYTYPVAGQPKSTWTPENLAICLNTLFRADSPVRHCPLVAFTYGGELGIALDEALEDGFLEIAATSSYCAWRELGFEENKIYYYLGPRKFSIDGYNFSSIRKIVDTSGITEAGFNGVKNISKDLTALGINFSGIVRVSSTSDSGTYVFNSATSDTLTISEHTSFSSDDATIRIYGDYFAVPNTLTDRTLYEIFIDAYDGETAELKGAERVEYRSTPGSSDDPVRWFDVVDISRDFRACSKRVNFKVLDGVKVVTFGDQDTGLAVQNMGTRLELPTSNVEGFRFKLYDYDGANYIEFEIANNGFLSTTSENAIDIDVFDRVSEERYIQIATVLHDSSQFKHLLDKRLFGNVGRKDIRDDFTRDYVSYPNSVLHGNGIIRGFDVFDSSGNIDAYGGEIVVNGSVFSMSRKVITAPEAPSSSIYTYNLFVDSDGIWNLLRDNQFVNGQISTPSLEEIVSSSDKTIIAQIDIGVGGTISAIRDYRRFVCNVNNNIDLLVEENDMTHGSFASLNAAVNYINASGSLSPISRTIIIRGNIIHDLSSGAVILPNKTTVRGSGGVGGSSNQATITITGSGISFIIPGSDCSLENLTINYDVTGAVEIQNALIGQSASSIQNLIIKNCYISNVYDVSSVVVLSADTLTNCSIIGCVISCGAVAANDNNIFVATTVNNLILRDSVITLNSLGGDNLIANFGTITNSLINNCTFNFPTIAAGTNVCFYFSNSSLNCISNCKFSCNSPSALNVSVAILDTITSELNINNCYFTNWNSVLYGTGTFNKIIVSNNIIIHSSILTGTPVIFDFAGLTYCEDLQILNNILELNASSGLTILNCGCGISRFYFCNNCITSDNAITDILNLNSVELSYFDNNCCALNSITSSFIKSSDSFVTSNICENILNATAKINNFVTFLTAASINIENNIVSSDANFEDIAIKSVGQNYYVNIINNKFFMESGISNGIIKLSNCSVCNIESNMLLNFSDGTATGKAINIVASSKTIVLNNIIYNYGAANVGFQESIVFDGADNDSCCVSKNIIQNFYGNINSSAIHLTHYTGIVEGNNVYYCQVPLYLYNCYDVVVVNNILASTSDTGSKNAVLVDGSSLFSSYIVHMIFVNNLIIDHLGNADLFKITNTNGSAFSGIVASNCFKHNSALSEAYSLIRIDSNNFNVIGNFLSGGTYTSNAPMKVTGNNCYVAFNNLTNVVASSAPTGKVEVSGTGSLDLMNKGGTYCAIIPVSRAAWDTSSGWEHYLVSDPYKVQLKSDGTGNGQAAIEFSCTDIPNGATLVQVQMYVSVSATNDLSIRVRKSAWNETGTTGTSLITSTNPSGTGYTIVTLAFPASTYMDNISTYCVYLTTDASATTVWVDSVYITYIL